MAAFADAAEVAKATAANKVLNLNFILFHS
jgi:hypothetical protein